MTRESQVDAKTDRKFFLDYPENLGEGQEVTFILNLHGGGSSGGWQRQYFPACDLVDAYSLVVATPTAATAEPTRHWAAEADDEHLKNVVSYVIDRFGVENIRAFWLAGHSQGGMTSFRLLAQDWFADRVDGFLSLSGGRIGTAPRAEGAGRPRTEAEEAAAAARARGTGATADARRARPAGGGMPTADFSFIYAIGEHEIASLPETSPWAEKYAAGPRQQLPDVVDTEAGQVHDGRFDGVTRVSSKQWGLLPRPGTAKMWIYPDAKDGRVIADVVRIDKGHTEGLEPKVTEELVKLIASAPGGKLRAR